MNYNLKKANIPKDSISNLNDNDMLECGNECILNFDNLSWKGKTSPYINSEYITLKKQQSVPSNYQYLKLFIIENKGCGYIIYNKIEWNLHIILIPLFKNSNIHKYDDSDSDDNIREIIFIYKNKDKTKNLCMSVFIDITFNDINTGDNFFSDLATSTLSSTSSAKLPLRNNWLPTLIIPNNKSHIKYKLNVFPISTLSIADPIWILFKKKVYINSDAFKKVSSKKSTPSTSSSNSLYNYVVKGSLTPTLYYFHDRSIYKQTMKKGDMSVKCFLKDTKEACNKEDEKDSEKNKDIMSRTVADTSNSLTTTEIQGIYGDVIDSMMPNVQKYLLIVFKIFMYIFVTFFALKVSTWFINRYNSSWLIHGLEYIKWKITSKKEIDFDNLRDEIDDKDLPKHIEEVNSTHITSQYSSY